MRKVEGGEEEISDKENEMTKEKYSRKTKAERGKKI